MLLLIVSLCLLLTACNCNHEWNDAECLLPKTCALCGKTEGNPLGHDWYDATCVAPKTCALCGETEGGPLEHDWQEVTCAAPKHCSFCKETVGESLPHTWIEANYQSPKRCSVCNTTEGQALEADFDKYGLEINMFENRYYTEKTEAGSSFCSRDPYFPSFAYSNRSGSTTGETYLCNYRIFDSDDSHMAVDGYRWKALDIEITFTGEDVKKHGITVDNIRIEDYYSIDKFDNSHFDLVGTEWEYLSDTAQGLMVNYNGVDCPVILSLENNKFGGWFTSYVETEGGIEEIPGIEFTASVYVCVPIGYNGIVFGFAPPSTAEESPIYESADEDLLLMRFGNTLDYWWNGGIKP